MKKGLIAENVETEYFHRKVYVWLQWIDSVWSEAYSIQLSLLEVRDPITICELLLTFESPGYASNPPSPAAADVQVGCPGGAITNAAPQPH